MTELDQKLKELFEKWKEQSEFKEIYENYFYRDGVIDSKKYLKGKHKILFLLKETNGCKFQSIKCFYDTYFNKSSICYSPCKSPLIMWRRIREWTEGVSNGEKYVKEWAEGHSEGHSYENILAKNVAGARDENDRLRQIAVININKYFGSAVANDEILQDHAAKEKELILEEIQILNPDIIICGDTWRHLEIIAGSSLKRLNAQDGGKLTLRGKDVMVIDMYHPSSREKKKDLYDILMTKYAKLYLRIMNENIK